MSPSRKYNWFNLCFALSILLFLLAGCGGQSETPPAPTAAPAAAAPTEAPATTVPTLAAEPTEANVETTAEGEFDARTLPQFAGAEIIYEDQTQLIYVTPADVASVADFSRKELAALGWQEYKPPFSQVTDDPNLKPLTFKKDGQGLSAFITVAPAQGNKTSVQYSPIPLEADLPALADAAGMEFSDTQLYLGYTTASDFDAVIAFYREQMASPEWQEVADMTVIEPEQARLVFANPAREMALVLDLAPAGDGRTNVTAQPMTDEVLAAASDPAPTEEASIEATEEIQAAGADMPELPTPTDAQDVNYEAETGYLSFNSPAKIDQLVEFYRQALPEQGWQEDEDLAFIQEDAFASLDFTQGEASLTLTIFRLGEESEVTISLSGMDASVAAGDTGEIPTGSSDNGSADAELTAEDKDGLPVPDNYTNYSSEGSQFSRTVIVTVPADLTRVIEFYRSELPAQGWQEQVDAGWTETSAAAMAFSGDNGDLSVKLSQSGDEIEITLALKDTAAAKEAGVLPPEGQVRLYFGNITEAAVTFSINQQKIKVDPQDPSQDSMEGVPNIDLPPGKYQFTLTLPGQPAMDDEIEVGPNETWGVLAGPGGALSLQLY